MKKRLMLLLALATLLCVAGWTGYGQMKNSSMPRPIWEYKVVRNPSDEIFTELGAQGWELVSVAAYGNPSSGSSESAYFKRAK